MEKIGRPCDDENQATVTLEIAIAQSFDIKNTKEDEVSGSAEVNYDSTCILKILPMVGKIPILWLSMKIAA